MKEISISSLSEYVSNVKLLFDTHFKSKVLFFRGLRDSSYKLTPTVFREDHPESDFSHDFRDFASIYNNAPPHNELDRWLFIMQHHGLPTRLLDWSESPLVALHFALHNNKTDRDASIVVLDPTRLNCRILGGNWFPDRNDENYKYRFLKAFYRNPEKLPWDTKIDFSKVKEKFLPLAIRPTITHERMVAQKSVFTIHGDDKDSIDEMLSKRKLSRLLIRYTIPADRKKDIEFDLKNIGITRSIVFPDLDGLAEDIVSRSKNHMQK